MKKGGKVNGTDTWVPILVLGAVLQPEIHNKPKATISIHEELRAQRKWF